MQGQHIRDLPDILPHAAAAPNVKDSPAPPGRGAYHQWAVGGLALLLLIAGWGAWVWLVGLRPCALSALFWR